MVFTNVGTGSTKKTLEKSEKNTQYAWAKYMSKVNDQKVDILKRVEYKNDKQLKHTLVYQKIVHIFTANKSNRSIFGQSIIQGWII